MYQYRIVRPVRLVNSDTLTAVLDLGFHTTTEVTFKIARIAHPDLDLASDVDPAVELRQQVVQWFKTAPRPWLVQMYREGSGYKGDILDKNGHTLTDQILKTPAPANDDTQVIHGLPIPNTDPASFS